MISTLDDLIYVMNISTKKQNVGILPRHFAASQPGRPRLESKNQSSIL